MIIIFKIQPVLDLAGFTSSNLAGDAAWPDLEESSALTFYSWQNMCCMAVHNHLMLYIIWNALPS